MRRGDATSDVPNHAFRQAHGADDGFRVEVVLQEIVDTADFGFCDEARHNLRSPSEFNGKKHSLTLGNLRKNYEIRIKDCASFRRF